MVRRKRKKRPEYFIVDDGTMDTVINIGGIEHRTSSESYRWRKGRRVKKDVEAMVDEIVESDERYW